MSAFFLYSHMVYVGAGWGGGEEFDPKEWALLVVPSPAHLKPSTWPLVSILSLKLLPTTQATLAPFLWALPGWWFLLVSPCWWWPGGFNGHKPDGTPPTSHWPQRNSAPVMSELHLPPGLGASHLCHVVIPVLVPGELGGRHKWVPFGTVQPPHCRQQLGILWVW